MFRNFLYTFLLIQSIGLKGQKNTYQEVKERFDIMNHNSNLKIEFNDKIYNQINRYVNEITSVPKKNTNCVRSSL